MSKYIVELIMEFFYKKSWIMIWKVIFIIRKKTKINIGVNKMSYDLKKVEKKFHEYLKERLNEEIYRID